MLVGLEPDRGLVFEAVDQDGIRQIGDARMGEGHVAIGIGERRAALQREQESVRHQQLRIRASARRVEI